MISIAGGVYLERCLEPFWNQLYGSGGRAAAVLGAASNEVTLYTYLHPKLERQFVSLAQSYGFVCKPSPCEADIGFDYIHCLSTPHVTPRVISQEAPIYVEAPVILRYGMLEGTAVVKGERVVYDPQSAFDPRPFGENGSSADSLAVLVNGYELDIMTGKKDPETGARQLIAEGAEVVVVKRGSLGCLIVTKSATLGVPAYRSDFVWSIGSGDVFAAVFAHYWAEKREAPEIAADLASKATAAYCGSMSLPLRSREEMNSLDLCPIGPLAGDRRVYLAGPFFNLTQKWMVEEARSHLLAQGMDVFSPFHDIGPGPAEMVAPADLKGLDGCDRMLALVDGGDVGTIFEIGYARAKGIPVVAFAQKTAEEDLKMLSGSGCAIIQDFVTAIYHTSWMEGV